MVFCHLSCLNRFAAAILAVTFLDIGPLARTALNARHDLGVPVVKEPLAVVTRDVPDTGSFVAPRTARHSHGTVVLETERNHLTLGAARVVRRHGTQLGKTSM